mmetsp:Transcript_17060/g.19408  ORF Transcript_17060/g.19408 Transcript_17060/m.19408 type:complete len:401 (+) Transcript_17060:249-1451(+)|eukprot:CAMPEP_0184040326 /NCGR_PEP_ID=MMETSP0955-20130417/57285_1 /TAXON_ID=627963 /ORGANISM="Aplanochytrium sp, Strain PBS07" /LENGTH=400 /DNA_ID=CAMNT_0026330049 /DNA_START=177 /DNA_END=1379 /DNA_ORIENTATION=-
MSSTRALSKEFKHAYSHSKDSIAQFDIRDKLILYSLLKQALVGDCNRTQPAPEQKLATAKWKAWMQLKGMGKEDAMAQYIDELRNRDPTFVNSSPASASVRRIQVPAAEVEEVNRQLKETEKEFSDLPRLVTKEGRMEAKIISLMSKIDPVRISQDVKARDDLLNRLKAFYTKHNKPVLKGIEKIVDYALQEGEEKLNQKLMNQYGEDLDSFMPEGKIVEAIAGGEQLEDPVSMTEESERDSLQEKFVIFFLKNDPERVEGGFDMLHDYIEARGSVALNKKLFKKYGEDLDTMFGGKSVAAYKKKLESEFASSEPSSGSSASNPGLNKSSSFKNDDIYELLTAFFNIYEPKRVKAHKVDDIYDWGQRNGLEALNRQLKKRFGKSLNEFESELQNRQAAAK